MTDLPLRIFIGYDKQEIVSYHVLGQSIIERTSAPVTIAPVALSMLGAEMWRERDPKQSTDFSFSRFLVPYLCGYKGWAVFMDCDMICRDNMLELWDISVGQGKPVSVVKHDYQPKETTKFLGHAQTRYEKKNWSSVMVFDCEQCTALTPDVVNTASGLELHQFKWLQGDDEIGELPRRWNHLVGVYKHDPDAALVHFTEGGPWFNDYQSCDYSDEWMACWSRMMSTREVPGTAIDERLKAKFEE